MKSWCEIQEQLVNSLFTPEWAKILNDGGLPEGWNPDHQTLLNSELNAAYSDWLKKQE